MSRSFAVTDIHGCAKTFIALIEDIIQLKKEDQLYLLGDYIDRGPDTKGVIDYILHLKDSGYQIFCLKGNHEEMILQAFHNEEVQMNWLKNGGDATMESFGIWRLQELPEQYYNFFNTLEYFFLLDKFILAHAGINFDAADPFSDKESMLWTRKFTVDPVKSGNRIVVHGHTPTALFEIQKMLHSVKEHANINLDNGCVFKTRPFYGHLCCLQLDNLRLFLQENID